METRDRGQHPPKDTTEPVVALGKRARNRLAVEAQILRVARRHLVTDGAASLSLRAVAQIKATLTQ